MDVKRLGLFLCKLFLNLSDIQSDGSVIIVHITGPDFGRMTLKFSCWGNSLGKDAEGPWEIWRGLSIQGLPSWPFLDTMKSTLPVMVAICVLTADPSLEITEKKSYRSSAHAKQVARRGQRVGRTVGDHHWTWRCTMEVQFAQNCRYT